MGGGLVSGCEAGLPAEPGVSTSGTADPGDTATAGDPPEDPDLLLLGQLRAELEAVWRSAQRVRGGPGAAHARTARELLGAQRRVLREVGATDTTPPRPGAPGIGRLIVLERRLQASYRRGALAAQSGSFARLLAAMSAGIAQLLTTVPEDLG